MRASENILNQACTTDCPRYCAGNCPFPLHEQDRCPRVRAIQHPLQDDADPHGEPENDHSRAAVTAS